MNLSNFSPAVFLYGPIKFPNSSSLFLVGYRRVKAPLIFSSVKATRNRKPGAYGECVAFLVCARIKLISTPVIDSTGALTIRGMGAHENCTCQAQPVVTSPEAQGSSDSSADCTKVRHLITNMYLESWRIKVQAPLDLVASSQIPFFISRTQSVF